ncbi:hypothetical protein [Streptomyces sp. NPDC001508]|uniref:hypothetical protein n=1 Tax=unclassified Streptomyces TaxID=2593676 RepID=UPI00331E3A88
MSRADTGLLVGVALGYAGWFGGFRAFLLVAGMGAVGWIAGRFLDTGTVRPEFFGSRDGGRDDHGPGRPR